MNTSQKVLFKCLKISLLSEKASFFIILKLWLSVTLNIVLQITHFSDYLVSKPLLLQDNGPWKSPQVDNPQDFSLSQILSSTSLNESGKKDSKVKKFTKLSQKERKRLEEEKAKTGETVPVSPGIIENLFQHGLDTD